MGRKALDHFFEWDLGLDGFFLFRNFSPHHGSKIFRLDWMWTFVFDFFWLEELERHFSPKKMVNVENPP